MLQTILGLCQGVSGCTELYRAVPGCSGPYWGCTGAVPGLCQGSIRLYRRAAQDPSPSKLQAERATDHGMVFLALSSSSHPCARCVTNQICPPVQLEINSRNTLQTQFGANQPQCSSKSKERVQRHCPFTAVCPHHSVTLCVWNPWRATTCLGKWYTTVTTSLKGPGNHSSCNEAHPWQSRCQKPHWQPPSARSSAVGGCVCV